MEGHMADLSKVCKREELEAQREPHWHPQLREGAHLGFRPSKKKGRLGTWIARARDRDSGKYKFRSLGEYADLSAKRSEEHTSELQSLMRISYAVFCLKKKKIITKI